MSKRLDYALADINKGLYQEYATVGMPAEDRLIETLDQNTVSDSMRDAVKARRMLGEVDSRNRSRYGVTRNTAQVASSQRRNSLSGASATVDAGNSAMLQDDDNRVSTLQDLINQGTELRNSAQQGLGVAARNQEAERQADAAAREAKKQRNTQIAGSVLAIAAMAMI